MKKLSSAEVRQLFLDFFKGKDHQVEPSAPLVPKDDPSLLWINSGVATLKKYFDGTIIPDNPRLVNAQKAIRTNDIENVGYTARHHTFFEMLGNFSIGDYFKEEAIQLAWEFLTSDDWVGFDEELLSVTVHPEDDEAYDIWLNDIKLPEHRIIRLEENFWDIGEGPSGPNTEIFYDRGPKYGNDSSDPELYPGGENGRYLEIWNLVFSQFNHNPDDTYTPLPNKNIDTGMGLERIVSIIQDVPTNFETDLFMPLISQVETLTNLTYGEDEYQDVAFKVIVDHIRTVTFAIGDSAIPSNEGRGYVLRRLIRRAVRFAKQIGFEEPFMYKLVATVGEIMEDFYPEVLEQKEHIENVVKNEEERFYETLNDGLSMLSEIIAKEKSKGNTVFPGVEIFRLYDTYGFPKELTEEYVAEHGFSIDEQGFNVEMKKQQERARSARQHVDSMQVQDEILSQITDDSSFIGYDHHETKTTILKMIRDGEFIQTANKGDTIYLVLEETPFYAESGGQVADKGRLLTETAVAHVKDVNHAPKGQHIHQVFLKEGDLHVGDEVHTLIERNYRNGIIKNHTATHLLHQALKDVLGDHVNQAGSLVGYDRLRFDFTHFESVSNDELVKIEQIINERVWESLPLFTQNMDIDKAKEMGAMALFGEKYSDIVRVVQIGDYSIELCGGCHVQNTAEIGLFKIISESGIGAGTRRIEAVTSKSAYQFLASKINLLNESANQLKVSDDKVPTQVNKLLQEIQSLQKENESLSDRLLNIESSSMIEQFKKVQDVNVLAEKVNTNNMNQLRNMVDEFKEEIKSGVVLLASQKGEKVQLAAGVTEDLIKRGLHAGHLINEAAKQCEGGGGGRPDMAQAGGNNPEKIDKALQTASNYITAQLDK